MSFEKYTPYAGVVGILLSRCGKFKWENWGYVFRHRVWL